MVDVFTLWDDEVGFVSGWHALYLGGLRFHGSYLARMVPRDWMTNFSLTASSTVNA